MQYAFLLYRDEQVFASTAAPEVAQRMDHMRTILDTTARDGTLAGAVRLQDTATSKTARRRGGAVTFHDGPFAETKEFLAGFLIIDCATEADAAQWAERLTDASCSGVVEYRPVAQVFPTTLQPDDAAMVNSR